MVDKVWLLQVKTEKCGNKARNGGSGFIEKSEESKREGRYSEAAQASEEALKIARLIMVFSLSDVFSVYSNADRVTEAEEALQEAQVQLEKGLGPHNPILIEMYMGMAACCRRAGKLDKAKEYEDLAKRALSGQ